MKGRGAEVLRETKETYVNLSLSLDGKGECSVATGIPFFDHMLHAMCRHGMFDLTLSARGDLEVDVHHTIEDVGIVLGDAVRQAIGEGKGITRFGHALVPMDESLATVAIDCGGRAFLVFNVPFTGRTVGKIETDIIEHFFHSLVTHAKITANIKAEGRNDHHRCEAVFKAFGIALGMATSRSRIGDTIPSTKGTLG